MNSKKAIELINKVSIYELIDFDGCLCGSCSIQGIDIEISCRKSSQGCLPYNPDYYGAVLRVFSHGIDHSISELKLVSDLVLNKLDAENIIVRLCDFNSDKDNSCVWCRKPRINKESYFCEEHNHMMND